MDTYRAHGRRPAWCLRVVGAVRQDLGHDRKNRTCRYLVRAAEVRVDRVLGAGPFREIGQPRVTAVSFDGTRIVVGGEPAWRQWHAQDVSRRSRPNPGWYPVAVYRADDLTCLHHLTTRWPAKAIASHPTLPLVAIGTGAYDGGWAYDGELILLNLMTGDAVSVLADSREVRRIAWRDQETLDLVLAVPCDEDEERFGTTSLACSIRRDDWDRAAVGMLRMPYGEEPVPDEPQADPHDAAAVIERYCRERGREWTPRRAVWAVHALADGRILAALEGVGLECWSSMSGEVLWRSPTDGTGFQIRVPPDGRTAIVLTQTPRRYRDCRWVQDPSVVMEIDLADGTVQATYEPSFAAVMVSRADGWLALRDTRRDTGTETDGVALWSPSSGAWATTVRLTGYDLFNHFFDVRYARELLFLQGRGDEPWRDKWVVAVDPQQGRARRLFPLEWDAARGGHLFGGHGAYLADRSGPALVYTGMVHDGAGLLPGNVFVVCRSFPDGGVRWVFAADHQATSLDADSEFVYVAFNSGELVVLGARDGAVHVRQELRVDGHPVVPLSLTRVSAGRLAIGTLDGRVLDCSLPTLRNLDADRS